MYQGFLENQIHHQESVIDTQFKFVERADPSFIPVYLTGGIGDAIMSITTLRRLKAVGYQLLIYSPHAEAFRYFYKDTLVHKGHLPEFTWSLHLDSIARFHMTDRFSGFTISDHRHLFDRQIDWFRQRPDMEHLVRQHPKFKYVLTRKCQEMGLNARTLPLHCLGFRDIEEEKPEPRKRPENYITIHDGFDINNLHEVSSRCTKTWHWTHWNTLVSDLSKALPQYQIIQLGTKTSRPIDGVHKNLINKTTLHEAFDIISRSRVHIDTDSGLAHAATQLGVPCVTMFGPTPVEFYGHKQNVNLTSRESCSGGCFHLHRNWMDKCPIGYSSPRCMDDIAPEKVLWSVIDALK